MFQTGALSILPRLASNFLKVFNPTKCNIDQNDFAAAYLYKSARMFNEIFMGKTRNRNS
jgi:hypothetical protein